LQRKRELRRADGIVKRMEDNLQRYRDGSPSSEEESVRDRAERLERELAVERSRNMQYQITIDRLREQVVSQGRQVEDVQIFKSALQKKTDQCVELEAKVTRLQARNVTNVDSCRYNFNPLSNNSYNYYRHCLQNLNQILNQILETKFLGCYHLDIDILMMIVYFLLVKLKRSILPIDKDRIKVTSPSKPKYSLSIKILTLKLSF
jgi:hypothetical protein